MFYLGPNCYPFKFLQAQDQLKREPLKEASNWSPELSTSSNFYLLPAIHIHHIKYNGTNSKYLTSASLTKENIWDHS